MRFPGLSLVGVVLFFGVACSKTPAAPSEGDEDASVTTAGGEGDASVPMDAEEPGASSMFAELEMQSTGPFRTAMNGDRVEALLGTFAAPGEPASAALSFVEEHGEALGIDPAYEIRPLGVREVREDLSVVSLGLMHDGLPVFGASVRIEIAADEIRYVSLDLPGAPGAASEPSVDAEAAGAAIEELLELDSAPEVGEAELGYFDMQMLVSGAGEPELVWRIYAGWPAMSVVYLSATSGQLLFENSMTPTEFDVIERSVSVLNARGQTGFETVLEEANHDVWITETLTSPDADEQAMDINRWTNASFDYFWGTFGWSSYDAICSEVRSIVNFAVPNGGANAFWSTGDPDVSGDEAMYVTEDYPATDDTIQHEFTHGVVNEISLTPPAYVSWSGALNESLADTFAAFLDLDEGMWLHGDARPDGAIRNLQSPRALGDPDNWFDSELLFTGDCESSECEAGSVCDAGQCRCVAHACDYGFVHTNSSVLNHAAYLMVEGGVHLEGLEVTRGIGAPKAEQIFFAAMHELGEHTDFFEWANMMMNACHRLAHEARRTPDGPIDWADCGSLVNAYAAVGVMESDQDYDGWPNNWDDCDDLFNPTTQDEGDCTEQEPQSEADAGVTPPVGTGIERADTVLIHIRDADGPVPGFVRFENADGFVLSLGRANADGEFCGGTVGDVLRVFARGTQSQVFDFRDLTGLFELDVTLVDADPAEAACDNLAWDTNEFGLDCSEDCDSPPICPEDGAGLTYTCADDGTRQF